MAMASGRVLGVKTAAEKDSDTASYAKHATVLAGISSARRNATRTSCSPGMHVTLHWSQRCEELYATYAER